MLTCEYMRTAFKFLLSLSHVCLLSPFLLRLCFASILSSVFPCIASYILGPLCPSVSSYYLCINPSLGSHCYPLSLLSTRIRVMPRYKNPDICTHTCGCSMYCKRPRPVSKSTFYDHAKYREIDRRRLSVSSMLSIWVSLGARMCQ